MKKLIILNIIIFLFLNGHSQKTGIYLENKKDQKLIILKEGKKVRIECNDGKILKGRLFIHEGSNNDTVITINNITCSVNDIIKIKRGEGQGLEIAGSILVFFANYFAMDLFAITFNTGLGIIEMPVLIICSIPTTVGLILICRHRYFKKDKWEMEIVKGYSDTSAK